MTRLSSTLAVVTGFGLCASLWLSTGAGSQAAQPAAGPLVASDSPLSGCPRPEPTLELRKVAGYASCRECHSSEAPKVTKVRGRVIRFDTSAWVLRGEVPIWEKEDAHIQAYAVLFTERSQKMGEILGIPKGIDPATKKETYHVHRDKRCLACHTGYPLADLESDAEHATLIAMDATEGKLDVELGVTCEGCHAPSRDVIGGDLPLKGWFDPHDTPEWRHWSPAKKRDEYGYVDVRSPVARTRMCLSCHMGNGAEGRVVTHEMYAAGHPVLPNFEIETFVRQMPRHWNEFADKSDVLRKEFLEKTEDPLYHGTSRGGNFDVRNLYLTKSMLVASMVTVAESLRLNAELASDSVAAPVEKGMWPEMAQFDCFACHHDLEDGGWRFERQPVLSRPGRPMLREWPGALLEVALRTAERKQPGRSRTGIDKLRSSLGDVVELVGQHPYGGSDSDRFADRACAAAKAADDLATLLEREAFSYGEAHEVLATIADVARDENVAWDYDSARQLAWAFETVLVEAETQADRGDKEENAWGLTRLPNGDALRGLVDSLGENRGESSLRLLTLDLRLARQRELDVAGSPFEVQEILHRERLAPIRGYDPLKFRETFEAIAVELKR